MVLKTSLSSIAGKLSMACEQQMDRRTCQDFLVQSG